MGFARKCLSGMLCLALLLGLLPTVALAAETLPTAGGTLSGEYTGGTLASGTYTLNGDVKLVENNITISGTVTIDLAGHTLTGTGTGSVITVASGGSLTLNDSGNDPTQPGKITGGSVSNTMGDDKPWELGGGVTVRGGTFIMNGGIIFGNSGTGGAVGGVNVSNGGTFTMTVGVITGNTSGGLNVTGSSATATIKSGAVIDNNNTTGSGGGVHVIGGGKVTLDGGSITGNTALQDGGGVFVGTGGTFILERGKIEGNKAENGSGGGIGVTSGKNGSDSAGTERGTLEIKGGEIKGNSAKTGGGVSVASGDKPGVLTMSGGVIVENTASECAGGLFQDGSFTVSGTEVVVDNNKTSAEGTETTCNVYLPTGKAITNGSLSGGNIGVTTQTPPIEGAPVTVLTGNGESALSWLESDNDSFELAPSGENVILQVKSIGGGGEEGGEDPETPSLEEEDITRAELAEKIQQHTPFGLSNESSNAYTVFTDVNDCSENQKNAIGVLYEYQYMGGTSAGKFSPDAGVTRAQAVAVIWRAAGSLSYTENVIIPYADVDTSQWYSPAIYCLYAMGVLDNTDMDGSGNFRINDYATKNDIDKWLSNCPAQDGGAGGTEDGEAETVSGGTSRVDFVVNIYNSLSQSDREKGDKDAEVPFQDIATCTPEQKEAITYFLSIEVISGTTETTFEPYAAASNAQIAKFLSNLAGALGGDSEVEAAPAAAVLRAGVEPWYADAVAFLVEEGVLTEEEAAEDAFIPHAPSLTDAITEWTQGLKPAAPTFSLSGGTYYSAQSVTMTAAAGMTIHYTTDGSTPTRESAVYQSSVVVSSDATLKAIAVKDGLASDVASATYVISTGGNSGGGNTSGSSSSGSSTSGVSGSGDNVSVSASGGSVTASQMTSAVNKADEGAAITVKASGSSAVTLPVGGMASAADNNSDVVVDLRSGEVILSAQAIVGMTDGVSASGKVEVSVTSQTGSGDDAISNLLDKGAAVFDVSVKVGDKIVHSFDGSLTLTFTVSNLSRIADPHVLHILTNGTREYYVPDRISGNTVTIRGIRNLSTFAVIPGSEVPKEPANPFDDVNASDYYYDAVLWAVENGVTNGISATTYGPGVAMTRGQMVTLLWRAYGAPRATDANPFTDVSESDYYYDAVLWAVANGITVGTSATTFGPETEVTRAQAVTFQWRAAGFPVVYGNNFDDVPADIYYANAVAWAVSTGITSGTGNNTFSPDMVVTRAQAVTFLYRELAE